MHSAWLLLVGLLVACSGSKGPSTTTPKKGPLTPKEIVERSSPAIVRVEVADNGALGVGTGFILDKSGLIATNLHVVRGSKDIKIKLYGGDVYQVTQIVGFDPDRDLALLRIQSPKALPTLPLGDSDAMTAGDQIVAIGNPLGQDYSVSSGLVSKIQPVCTPEMVALHNQNLKRFEELKGKYERGERLEREEQLELLKLACSSELKYIQISAPISQGSSGGPLFNQQGEVVGITTAIIKDGQNLNLAVPGNYLKPIVAKPAVISVDEFAKQTKEPTGPGVDDGEKVQRAVPDHPLTLLDGCKREQVGELVRTIWDAIEVGAPIYNKAMKEEDPKERQRYYEACYRIYEGTATKFEQSPPCKGVKEAFSAGLARAKGIQSYKLKAWAMRDTFDGLIEVAKKYANANPGPPLDKPKK